MVWQRGCPLVELVFPIGAQVPVRLERSPAADLYSGPDSGFGFDPGLAGSFDFGDWRVMNQELCQETTAKRQGPRSLQTVSYQLLPETASGSDVTSSSDGKRVSARGNRSRKVVPFPSADSKSTDP